jgi:carboxypeptidase family protein/TonB-dependent receptor-like protein
MTERRRETLPAVAGLLSAVVVFYFCFASQLVAQEGMATLSGVVSDSSGAAVPGAQVVLESTVEHASRQTITDATGRYVIPALNPGAYQLVVRAGGFETQNLTNIILSSGQGTTLNVTVTPAKTVTEVNVKEAPPLLETTTSTVGGEVTAQQFTELPTLGRNFTSLIGILPGVTMLPAPDTHNMSVAGTGLNPSVYGQRQRSNEYTIDGVPNLDVLYNGLPMYPPPEAIAEMKVQAGMDSGAYGFASGANINIVTKSGTNKYHGDAWEFLRNNALNARSFFIPNVGVFRWNQFGGTFGGPLVIPHLLSKERAWYFFGYYEGIRIHSASNYLALVPTAAELGGDFSGDPPIYNPYTSVAASDGSLVSRQLFGGNQIPSNLINQPALTIAKLAYPLPNLPPGLIPGVNFLNTTPNINTSNQWSVRIDHEFGRSDNFFARISEESNPTRSVGLPNLPSVSTSPSTNIAVNDTHVFSPTFLITGVFGMQRVNPRYYVGGPDIAKAAGTLAAFPPFEGTHDAIPPMCIAGYPSLCQCICFCGPGYAYTYEGGAVKTKGRHTISFGGSIKRNRVFGDCLTGTFECFACSQTALVPGSGDGLASFLLGLPEAAGRAVGHTAGDMSGNTYSYYLQDTFRVSPKLTLNLGLRWDYASPMHNSFGSATFEWQTGKYYWDLKNPITGAPPNIRRGLIPPDYRGYQPRLGVAYQINPKTVVRAASGVFSETFGVNYAQSALGGRGNWPYTFTQTLGNLNLTLPVAFLQNPFPGPPIPSPMPLGVIQGVNTYAPTSRTGYVEEWSFTVQRQIAPSLMAEAAYFGSHGVKLDGHIVDNTAIVPGTDPYQNRQRWPNFPPYTENEYNEFSSRYDGLSLKLQKRASKNLTFLIDYTWSKTLDNVDSLVSADNLAHRANTRVLPTRFNGNAFWGPAGFDVRNLFNASYSYEIPAKSKDKWTNAAIAHWSLSGIVSADGGVPYVVYLPHDNENIGTSGHRTTEFPNLVGDPNSITQRTVNMWFNTAAYQIPAFGTRGNAGKHALYSEPEVNWDSAIFKRWPFGETRDVEFRGEFFNFLNGHTFDPPGAAIGTPQFGKISATRQNGRQVQLALKVHF